MWATGSTPSTSCVRIIKSPQLGDFIILVAEAGIEPTFRGYEPRELPLLYSAILVILKVTESHNLEVIRAMSFTWSYLYFTPLSFRIKMIPQFTYIYKISLEKELFL